MQRYSFFANLQNFCRKKLGFQFDFNRYLQLKHIIVDVHIIILYASERKIAAEVKAFAAGSRRICSRGCKEKHPTMLKIATDDAKISCRNAVASYICIANCAILFALELVLRRPETSATKGYGERHPIGWRTESDRIANGI